MKNKKEVNASPEDRLLTSLQQKRLASLTGVSVKEIEGLNIIDLRKKFKWEIDPKFLFYQKICGKVVKKDPVTGVEYPVPFATVHVEDTDCNLLTFSPSKGPWVWHFPFFCKREVIATAKTDACGNFCVWVPRFDIDWILRWRKKRICFPIIFKRPRLIDYLDYLGKIPVPEAGPWPPIPLPDPGPLDVLDVLSPAGLAAIAGTNAERIAGEIGRIKEGQSSGEINQIDGSVLYTRVFENEMSPPLPGDFQKALSGDRIVAAKGASSEDGIRSAVAEIVGIKPDEISGFDPSNFIGPFYRCVDVFVREWQIVFDVPDITFRVTQDIDGDGTEETIYSEGYFDIRWNDTSVPDVRLVASSAAKESRICGQPEVPCGNEPAILFAGFMPLTLPGYFDDVTGYAVRPNRPCPSSPCPPPALRPPARTPFCNTVQFYGCVDIKNAEYYRILQSMDNGATFPPVTGLSWNNFLDTGGTPIPISADPNGWYRVNPINPATLNPVPRSSLEFQGLLLSWPSENGKSLFKVELGDAGHNSIGESAVIAVQADNQKPEAIFTRLSWKFAGEPDSALRNLLGIPCPMIKRGAIPGDIELVFEVQVSAGHLRNATLQISGCGGGAFTQIADPLNNPLHWHNNVFDNSEVLYQRYALSSVALPGCYGFRCYATSRSMNPSGADGGHLLPTDWLYDPVYIWTHPGISVAVVNEN